ncbi:hypothetical protein DPV79_23580 [Burkholderia reimsis]|uniref:Uncharacterized protein n=1 Tax=Burkholderia reimsis TaxID=2234132 RepID=A0A365QRC6_9BURK|nr:glycoside hydrolase family 75 protein [Burkholderia reimsis]RBB36984.1 hypothetical protein DPV79_23580 [Burkholderia reimsis]
MKAFLLTIVLVLGASSTFAQTCESLTNSLQHLDFSRAKELPVKPGNSTTFRMAYQECDAHDIFAGRALGSKHKCSSDPNHVERFQVFPDKTVVVVAKAAVDADGSALSQSRKGTSQPGTSLELGGKSLDAEFVPYIVIPGDHDGISLAQASEVGMGDLAIVLRGSRCSFAIVGDSGPFFKFGEISLAAHEELGNDQCLGTEKPCQKLKGPDGEGIGIERGVTYVIFPHSRPERLTAQDVRAVVATQGQKRLETFLRDYGAPTR